MDFVIRPKLIRLSLLFFVAFLTLKANAQTSYSSVKTQYIQTPSVRYAFRKYGANIGTPLVLLMHTRGNMDGWDPTLLDALAQNRTIIAFDNRGVGLTKGTAPKDFASMADDAAQFIKALGYKQVDLLGFSIGGSIAQELLLRHGSLIRRAILAGTSARGGTGVNTMSEKSKSISTKEKLTDDDLLYSFFAPSQRSQAMGRDYIKRVKLRTSDLDEVVSMDTVKSQAIAREEWGRSTPNTEGLKSITTPILVANGKDDIRMPTVNSYQLFQMLPKAQLILYPDSGHGFLFQYAKLCGQNFSEFLDQDEIVE